MIKGKDKNFEKDADAMSSGLSNISGMSKIS